MRHRNLEHEKSASNKESKNWLHLSLIRLKIELKVFKYATNSVHDIIINLRAELKC